MTLKCTTEIQPSYTKKQQYYMITFLAFCFTDLVNSGMLVPFH